MKTVYSDVLIRNETEYVGFLVRGRRWYQPKYDTTYHRAYIHGFRKTGEKIPLEATEVAVGGGLDFLKTAGVCLIEKGHFKASKRCCGEFMLNGLCLEDLNIGYMVQDVDSVEDL